jgi:hypothetical protein
MNLYEFPALHHLKTLQWGRFYLIKLIHHRLHLLSSNTSYGIYLHLSWNFWNWLQSQENEWMTLCHALCAPKWINKSQFIMCSEFGRSWVKEIIKGWKLKTIRKIVKMKKDNLALRKTILRNNLSGHQRWGLL